MTTRRLETHDPHQLVGIGNGPTYTFVYKILVGAKKKDKAQNLVDNSP